MTVQEFREAFRKEIDQVLARISRRYSVTDEEMAIAFYSSAKKYIPEMITGSLERPAPSQTSAASRASAVGEFVSSLNCDDLCLAVACAKGDETAWEDFFRDYRSYLVSIARSMTQDAGAAEQLADSTFADLYGLRESGGSRVSKFSFYSGRGSLRGWLRAVLYQLSADSHRQSSRYVQTEESEDIDRLALAGSPRERQSEEIAFIHQRYRSAVSEALRKAIGQLESRDRLLLAYYYYDEMTLREIARLFDVHEATISRWLTKVQRKARKLVDKCLQREHRFNRSEAAEAMELAAEQADISIREYLIESVSSDRQGSETSGSRKGTTVPVRLD